MNEREIKKNMKLCEMKWKIKSEFSDEENNIQKC